MKKQPTQRTLEVLKETGVLCQKVEYWNTFAKRRIDLFGFIDIVAVQESRTGFLCIQATTDNNISERIKKVLEKCSESARRVLQSGNSIEVWGWREYKPRGKKSFWDAKRWEIVLMGSEPLLSVPCESANELWNRLQILKLETPETIE